MKTIKKDLIQSAENLKTPNTPNWCPGCGDFAIWTAFKDASISQNWNNSNSVLLAGIGCHGHLLNFIKVTGFEGLHGRILPVAEGLKMANRDINVFVFTGDGDCLAEGGNHFMHACRRNFNITVILHDNAIYGLTTGQTSPRSPVGFKSKSTPSGNIEEPLHPLRIALSAGATFLARAYSGDVEQLTDLLIKAHNHNGFSVVQVLQPCVTFNKEHTHISYQRNTYALDKNYDPTNKKLAFEKTLEWGENQIPTGIIYQEQREAYEAQIPEIKDVTKRDISALMKKFC